MTPEEINKKIAELLHSRLNLINGESLSSEELQKEVEGAAKEIADMVFKEISSMPTIKGWVTRDENGQLWLYGQGPYRNITVWTTNNGRYFIRIDPTLFPALRWEDEPIQVELPIIRK